jgi:predicted DNA-binding transcriptional regulator AlpA
MSDTVSAPKHSRRYSRFKDLKERGVVNGRDHLNELVEKHGFPAPFRLSHKSLVWADDEVDAWIETKRVAA